MSEVVIDGFRFSKWAGGKLLLVIESTRLRECIAYCNANRVDRLIISPYHGYALDDIDFLRECPHVIEVFMQRGFTNYDGLLKLPKLRILSAIFPHAIDITQLPSLTDFSTDWNPKIDRYIVAVKSLKRLWLRGYKPKTRDLTALGGIRNLGDFSIVISPIHSIAGVEALHRLRRLEVSYCRRLESIGPLARLAGNLEEIEIDHCKNIQDLTSIEVLKRLRKAILSHSGILPSLDFIRQMPRLEFLSFVGMNVLDGDMTPCFKLKYAGFLKKRHYSHTPEQVQEIIESGKGAVMGF